MESEASVIDEDALIIISLSVELDFIESTFSGWEKTSCGLHVNPFFNSKLFSTFSIGCSNSFEIELSQDDGYKFDGFSAISDDDKDLFSGSMELLKLEPVDSSEE